MKLLEKNEAKCIACGRCEEICANAYFKQENREKSCIQISEKQGENKINVCNQCGVCIDICPVEALYRDKNDVVRVKKDICVGCFMCVGFCPEEAMRQHDDYIEPFKCIACGLCVRECPTEAIFIGNRETAAVLETIAETAVVEE
ncbi:Fe-S-cluster-containing dehydrogenase component [Geosporobacter subterraneus DSM 17957]|uniref:Fe-S-cluster-containing dehydrogenase component n=1 Tax=Geosporobacter subterraneus DSM 17957 TaxID=1121919 RepID=A0A1M6K492_9FIRM|nr:4Fe-4S binding protein [Geosporobacter subterraneus]SHJ53715.1 Fe-S-cluster-containing dehydrogenase component [Geosporobacter subterraneus DSM 17957]